MGERFTPRGTLPSLPCPPAFQDPVSQPHCILSIHFSGCFFFSFASRRPPFSKLSCFCSYILSDSMTYRSLCQTQ